MRWQSAITMERHIKLAKFWGNMFALLMAHGVGTKSLTMP
jgi:hypothetical protein